MKTMDFTTPFVIWGKSRTQLVPFLLFKQDFINITMFWQNKRDPRLWLLGILVCVVQNHWVWRHILNPSEEASLDLSSCVSSLHGTLPMLLHWRWWSPDDKVVFHHELFCSFHHVQLLCSPNSQVYDYSQGCGSSDYNFAGTFSYYKIYEWFYSFALLLTIWHDSVHRFSKWLPESLWIGTGTRWRQTEYIATWATDPFMLPGWSTFLIFFYFFGSFTMLTS